MTIDEFMELFTCEVEFQKVEENPHLNLKDQSKHDHYLVWTEGVCVPDPDSEEPGDVIPAGSQNRLSMNPWSLSYYDFPHLTVPRGTEPTFREFLLCLLSDISTVVQNRYRKQDNGFVYAGPYLSFGDWAKDLGYDEDSRKAYQAWENIVEFADAVGDWMGIDLANKFLEVEDC